jgi:hypothetical protein
MAPAAKVAMSVPATAYRRIGVKLSKKPRLRIEKPASKMMGGRSPKYL